MNRIENAIAKTRALLDNRALEDLELLESKLDLDAGEHFVYQTAQANAHAMGRLSVEEAQVVYSALGPRLSSSNGGWPADVDLAVKIVVTQLMGELLVDPMMGVATAQEV